MAKRKRIPICSMHDDISRLCGHIEKLDFGDNKMLKRRVMALVKKIEAKTKKAKTAGQKMEDRLGEYFDSITSLGYSRN
jgi:hypothetical protein